MPFISLEELAKALHLAGDFSFNRRLSFEIYGNMKLGFSLFMLLVISGLLLKLKLGLSFSKEFAIL